MINTAVGAKQRGSHCDPRCPAELKKAEKELVALKGLWNRTNAGGISLTATHARRAIEPLSLQRCLRLSPLRHLRHNLPRCGECRVHIVLGVRRQAVELLDGEPDGVLRSAVQIRVDVDEPFGASRCEQIGIGGDEGWAGESRLPQGGACRQRCRQLHRVVAA